MSARGKLHLGDTGAVIARHRDLFVTSPMQRLSAFAAPFGIIGLAVFALWWLSIPFDQIAQGLVSLAKRGRAPGATVIEVNLTPTEVSGLADVGLYGKSGEILPELCGRIGITVGGR